MKEQKRINGLKKVLVCLFVLVAVFYTFSLMAYADKSKSDEAVNVDTKVNQESVNEEAVDTEISDGTVDDLPAITETPAATAKPKKIGVKYSTHVQTYGWMDYVSDGKISGTEGEAKRLECIRIKLKNNPYEGGISYRTHVQSYGWMDWVSNGKKSGTVGKAKRLEAIQIKLTGEVAEYYDVYYRVHIQSYGWLDWACNGQSAGSSGLSKRLEAIQIRLVKKGDKAPGDTSKAFVNNSSLVKYKTYVQSFKWRDYSYDGEANGSWGIDKRVEGIKIRLNTDEYSGSIRYRTHVQSYGWMDWVKNGALSGTSGKSKRVEAIEIKLTGTIAKYYDVYYRVNCQSYGWMKWVKNGATAGTVGEGKRLEAIQIIMCKKGEKPKFPSKPKNKMVDPDKRTIDPNKPMIAITYDDGPGPYTDQVLDVLEKYDVKATFFVIGNRVGTYPNQLKRAYKLGCQIGNHTWSHPMLAGLSSGDISSQISKTDAKVKSVIGVNPTVMRPPGGSMNATVKATVGKPLIMWSVDPQDWKYRDSAYVTRHVLNNVKDGDIVLLHDIHYTTAVATETLIPALIEKGYQLVTLDELAYYKGYNMKAGKVYNSMR